MDSSPSSVSAPARVPELVGLLKPLNRAFALARQWPHLHLDNPDDYPAAEAVAAINRITSGNFRLTSQLVAQIDRILEINQISTVTKEVVEAARESLVIGPI